MADNTSADSTRPDNSDGDGLTLLQRIKKNIRESRRHFSDWRSDAKEDYDFFAGRQWDDNDIAILREQGRPAVAFNRIARTINAVSGLEVQNRQEVTYYPRQMSDAAPSELLTNAAKWVRDNCDAEDEESEAFQDSCIQGMGFTETRLDYETDSDGLILIERQDPFMMGVDHTAIKRNFDDKRFIFKIKVYATAEDYKQDWPGKDVPKSRFFDTDDTDQQVQDLSPGGYKPDILDDSSAGTKNIQVAQYQYYELEKYYSVQSMDGTLTEVAADQFKKMKAKLDEAGFKYTKVAKPKRKYKQIFLNAEEILNDEDDAPINAFTFRCITGLRDKNKNTWFGLVRMMKDPQRWANKWLSQIQHILNTQAKSGKILYEAGAFKNPSKAKTEWAKPDAMVEVNAGKMEMVKQLEAARYPDGLDRLLQYALSAVNDVPGVNLELMGLANRDQANVLEQSRKQAGVTILAVFFDSLRRYRKEQGRVLAEFIREYISDGRLIRINGPLGAQYIPLVRQPGFISYDVVVDDSPTSTDMKERTFAALMQILPLVLQAGIPVPPELLDYSPLPTGLVQDWKQYLQSQQQNPEVQQNKQLEQGAKVADIQYKKSQSDLNAAKAQKELSELNNPDSSMEAVKMATELQLKREQISAELALKREDILLTHHVNLEGKKMQADVAKKPTTTVSLGADDAVSALSDSLRGGIQGGNEAIMAALEQNSKMMFKGLEILGQSMLAGDKLLADAIKSPRELTYKNGKPTGTRVIN